MSYTEKIVSAVAGTDINTFKTMLLNDLASISNRVTVENDSVIDCSNLSGNNIYPIDDKTYYTLNKNTLMLV